LNPDEVVTGGALLLLDGNNEGNPSILEVGLPVIQPTEWFVSYYNQGPNDVSIGASAECAKLVEAT
jgi:hypothetical protein